MARDRNDTYDERKFDSRNERFRRERPWGYDDLLDKDQEGQSADYADMEDSIRLDPL